jgi:hypothetical protein
VVEVIRAASAERDGHLGGTGPIELLRVDAKRQVVAGCGRREALQVRSGECDLIHEDIHRVAQALPGRGRDQLVARHTEPGLCRHAFGYRVPGEEGDRRRLGGLFRQSPGKPGLAQLGLEREPVAGLELQSRGAVSRHLVKQWDAELQDLIVRGLRQHLCAARDPSLGVLLGVGEA